LTKKFRLEIFEMPLHKTENNLRAAKIEKMQLSVNDEEDVDEGINFDKMKVECICPKCGQKHVMNFHWIGRGIPRKYCPLCKGSV
jgi:hypothetical protein